jgi:hypothetical protein
MGVDQLVSGGDVDNPSYDSLTVNGTTTTDNHETEQLSVGADGPATSFDDIGGGSDLQWTKDSASPESTSQQITTINLDGEYDQILLQMRILATGSNGYLEIQLNGDTGSNYNYVRYDGSNTTGATNINITDDHRRVENLSLLFDGRFKDSCTVKTISGIKTRFETSVGSNPNISSPLNTIEIDDEYGANKEIVLYGRDIL